MTKPTRQPKLVDDATAMRCLLLAADNRFIHISIISMGRDIPQMTLADASKLLGELVNDGMLEAGRDRHGEPTYRLTDLGRKVKQRSVPRQGRFLRRERYRAA